MNIGLILIVALVAGVLAMQIIMLRKLKRVDLHLWSLKDQLPRETQQNFRQLEALQSLYWDLKPSRALPSTRGWAGSPDLLREIAAHVLGQKPSMVVECSSGVSTIIIARSLELIGRGHVYSLEHSPEYAEATRNRLAEHGLGEWASVLDAPLIATTTDEGTQPWYDISGLPDEFIDMLVIDGPPEMTAPLARFPAGPVLFPRLSDTAAVFLDDANRPDERETVARWLKAHPAFELHREPCEKGLAVLRKTPQKGTQPVPKTA